MKISNVLVLASIMLITACDKKDSEKSQRITLNIPEVSSTPAPKSSFESYKEQQALNAQKFSQEIVNPGDCWAYEYTRQDQASFLKPGPFKTTAYILMAKDNGVVLFGQPEPDCQESYSQSAKCPYWIRIEKESDMFTFYREGAKKVACPAGVTVKAIADKAPSGDQESIDFSKVVLK